VNDLGKRVDVFCKGLPEFEDVLRLRMLFQRLWSPAETDGDQERRCDAGAGTCFCLFIYWIFSGLLELPDWGVAQLSRLLAEVQG
jgi:hypothetical protein